MKKASNDLFELVISLTKGEKIFFRNYIKSTLPGKSSHYIKLFNLIQRSKNPDEEKIKKQLGTRNYSKIKWYLYESITECLRLYYKESPDNIIAIHNLTLNAVILRKKALTKQSLSVLNKVNEIAIAEEKFANVQEINLMIANSVRNPVQLDRLKELNQNWLSATLDAIEKSKNIVQYTDLLNKLTYFIRSKGEIIRDQKELDELIRLMDDPLLHNEEKAITYTSKKHFFNINSIFSAIKGDYNMAYYYSSRQAEFMLSIPSSVKKNDPSFNNLLNAGMFAIYVKKWEEAQKYINLVKKIRPASKADYYTHFLITLNLEISLFNIRAEPENALLLVKQNEAMIKKNLRKLDPICVTALFASISESYFFTEEYKKALEWLKPVFYENTFNPSESLFISGKLFLLVLYYEVKDLDSLNQVQESLYRHLSYRNNLFDFEKTMISSFKKLLRVQDEKEKMTVFKELHSSLIELNKNPLNYIVSRVQFDYLTWVESKIKKVKFYDLFKEKMNE